MVFQIAHLHPVLFFWLIIWPLTFVVLFSFTLRAWRHQYADDFCARIGVLILMPLSSWMNIERDGLNTKTLIFTGTYYCIICIVLSLFWPLILLFLIALGCFRIGAKLYYIAKEECTPTTTSVLHHSDALPTTTNVDNNVYREWLNMEIQEEPTNANSSELGRFPYNNHYQLPVICVNHESISLYKLNEDSLCPICCCQLCCQTEHASMASSLLDTGEDKDACVTICDHVLHYGCLWEWMKRRETCPICRRRQLMSQCSLLRIHVINSDTVSHVIPSGTVSHVIPSYTVSHITSSNTDLICINGSANAIANIGRSSISSFRADIGRSLVLGASGLEEDSRDECQEATGENVDVNFESFYECESDHSTAIHGSQVSGCVDNICDRIYMNINSATYTDGSILTDCVTRTSTHSTTNIDGTTSTDGTTNTDGATSTDGSTTIYETISTDGATNTDEAISTCNSINIDGTTSVEDVTNVDRATSAYNSTNIDGATNTDGDTNVDGTTIIDFSTSSDNSTNSDGPTNSADFTNINMRLHIASETVA